MFNKIQEFLKNLTAEKHSFDPRTIGDDPLLAQIAWTPAKGGGANFRTHRLVQIDQERVEFRTSLGAKLFCMVFLLPGLAIMIFAPSAVYSEGKIGMNPETIFPVLFGLVFAGIGGSMLYFMARPAVFDKKNGHYWRGWGNPEKMLNPENLKNYTKLDRIHAIQLISEHCSGKNSSYYSYEINLVLEDASRINIVDHGDLKKIRDDAHALSQFLNKPVWDGIN
jgi:hypothetical protein